ncbi:biotin transporter BioY [Diplocloster modestus]|nr:biotin transporter BioY [Diplocloster modestus]
MMKQKISTRSIVAVGVFAAVIAVLSQISVPMPSQVPITLQTFAIALAGYVLGWKRGLGAVVVYVLLGAVGVPVFANFTAGFQVLVGPTGGFIFGFLGMAVLCGLGGRQKDKPLAILFSLLGLSVCHLAGALQFSMITSTSIGQALLIASVPYLIKDVISLVLAYVVGAILRKRLASAGILIYV